MRRFIIVAISILMCGVAHANNGFLPVIQYYNAAGGGGGGTVDCSGLGTYELLYHVDHASGATYACISGDTTTVTFSSVAESSSYNCTSSGTYGVLWDGACNKYVDVPATGITTGEGYIIFSIHTPGTLATADQSMLEWRYDADEYIIAKLKYNATFGHRLEVTINDSTGAQIIEGAYKTLSTDTCYTLELYWDQTEAMAGARWSTDAWSEEVLTSFSGFTTPTEGVRFGEDDTNLCFTGTGIGFDDIIMEATSPYVP